MNNLKKIREEKKITQIGLAAKAGVSTSTISLIENDSSYNPNETTLRCLAMALDVTVEELIKTDPLPKV